MKYERHFIDNVVVNISLHVILEKTRTTNVVRNAGCARSRYTLKLSLIFSINESMNELIN